MEFTGADMAGLRGAPSLRSLAESVLAYASWMNLAVALCLYLAVVQLLRFRNLRHLKSKYAAYIANPSALDYKAAHEILTTDMLYEFPFMWGFGTQWALVKSYAIANGTRLLVQTRQLTEDEFVGKRAEDTGVVLGEILVQGVDSERGRGALAKMNWLHRRYGSKITNGDMIHTLGLFILEPHRWVEMYEWREMLEVERVATFVYWKEIGARMGMQGIPETLDALKEWMVEYEKTNMYYSDDNKACTEATVNLFLRNVPGPLKTPFKQATAAFLEPRVRPMLGIENPPKWMEAFLYGFFHFRRLLIRHVFLPRFSSPYPVRRSSDGRLYRESYIFEPWYVKETWGSRLKSKLGLTSKPLPGPNFKSNGFMPEELGPLKFEQASRAPALKEAEQLAEYARGGGFAGMGCPFAFKA